MTALMAEHCRVVLAALVLAGCSPYERAREIRDERAFVARSEKMCAINSECDRNAWRRQVAIELVERNLRGNHGLLWAMTRRAREDYRRHSYHRQFTAAELEMIERLKKDAIEEYRRRRATAAASDATPKP